MRYYIADLHFGHGGLNNRMDNRKFESVEAMDEYMIAQWNSRVRRNDEVVILGDFAIYKHGEQVNQLLTRLKGRKTLILGNHDEFIDKKDFRSELLEKITPYIELNDNKRKIIISHYPIMCYNGQYRYDSEGNPKTYMLYGHVHNTFDEVLIQEYQEQVRKHQRAIQGSKEEVPIPCQMINCFCMFSDYIPLTLDEWIQVDRERREKLKCIEKT